jgi:Sigma-70 region 2
MDDQDWLAERFEANRSHLRRVAFRMLGSLTEADDAVQEAWIHLSRTDTSHVDKTLVANYAPWGATRVFALFGGAQWSCKAFLSTETLRLWGQNRSNLSSPPAS